jgi:hypothetical protein
MVKQPRNGHPQNGHLSKHDHRWNNGTQSVQYHGETIHSATTKSPWCVEKWVIRSDAEGGSKLRLPKEFDD